MEKTLLFCSDESKWDWSSATTIKSKPSVVIKGRCNHCAIEQLKKENADLKEYNDNCISRTLHDARVKQLESKLKVAVVTMQRRMKSDDACELPFDEDMAEALKEIES